MITKFFFQNYNFRTIRIKHVFFSVYRATRGGPKMKLQEIDQKFDWVGTEIKTESPVISGVSAFVI